MDKTHEDLILEVTLKKGLLDLCEREFVGKISRTKTFRTRLGKLVQKSFAPQKSPCSNTYAAACLFVTCLPQQNLHASSAIKVQTKWRDFIVITVLQCIIATYFAYT